MKLGEAIAVSRGAVSERWKRPADASYGPISWLTANLAMYLSMDRPSIRRASNNKPVQKSQVVIAPPFTTVTLRTRSKARSKLRVHKYRLGEDEGRVTVSWKTMVRGHWKRQAYGARGVLRKTIWVRPYVRHMDADGQAASHVYVPENPTPRPR